MRSPGEQGCRLSCRSAESFHEITGTLAGGQSGAEAGGANAKLTHQDYPKNLGQRAGLMQLLPSRQLPSPSPIRRGPDWWYLATCFQEDR